MIMWHQLLKIPQKMHVRCICTSQNLKASKMQLGRIVNKVMSSDRTKKSHKNTSPSLAISKTLNSLTKISSTTHKNRRVTVLNKIFMKYITDLMATGEIASQLVGKGIEVTHVKVAPDFKLVNVFWYSTDKENANDNTEKMLKESSGLLQHELSQLRVIGTVPPIQFVKNKHFGLMKEVEDRLAKVDFGEDFEPSAYIISNNNIPVLQTSLSDKEKQELSHFSNNNLQSDDICKMNIPEMKHDVMGVHHDSIMRKIKHSLQQIKKSEKNKELLRPNQVDSQLAESQIHNFLNNKQENAVFEDFLKKRSIEEKQKRKSISLLEAKLEDENAWVEKEINKDINEEINIDEEYEDEYHEIEKYK